MNLLWNDVKGCKRVLCLFFLPVLLHILLNPRTWRNEMSLMGLTATACGSDFDADLSFYISFKLWCFWKNDESLQVVSVNLSFLFDTFSTCFGRIYFYLYFEWHKELCLLVTEKISLAFTSFLERNNSIEITAKIAFNSINDQLMGRVFIHLKWIVTVALIALFPIYCFKMVTIT